MAAAKRVYTYSCCYCAQEFTSRCRVSGPIGCGRTAECTAAHNAAVTAALVERAAVRASRPPAPRVRRGGPVGDANGWSAVLAFQGPTKAQRLAAERAGR